MVNTSSLPSLQSKATVGLRQRRLRARERRVHDAIDQDSTGAEAPSSEQRSADRENGERDAVRKSKRNVKGNLRHVFNELLPLLLHVV